MKRYNNYFITNVYDYFDSAFSDPIVGMHHPDDAGSRPIRPVRKPALQDF